MSPGRPDADQQQRSLCRHPADVGRGPEVRYLRLHVKAGIALNIALATGEFRPGRYTRTDAWGNDWTRD